MGIKKLLGLKDKAAADADAAGGMSPSQYRAAAKQWGKQISYGGTTIGQDSNNPNASMGNPVVSASPPINDWQRHQILRDRYLPKHAHQAVPAIDHVLSTISQTVFKDTGILPEEDSPVLVEIMEKLAEVKELSKKLSLAQPGWRQKLRIPEEVKQELEKSPYLDVPGSGITVSNAPYQTYGFSGFRSAQPYGYQTVTVDNTGGYFSGGGVFSK